MYCLVDLLLKTGGSSAEGTSIFLMHVGRYMKVERNLFNAAKTFAEYNIKRTIPARSIHNYS